MCVGAQPVPGNPFDPNNPRLVPGSQRTMGGMNLGGSYIQEDLQPGESLTRVDDSYAQVRTVKATDKLIGGGKSSTPVMTFRDVPVYRQIKPPPPPTAPSTGTSTSQARDVAAPNLPDPYTGQVKLNIGT